VRNISVPHCVRAAGKLRIGRVGLFTGAMVVAGLGATTPAHAHLQCVPYARQVSGIEIYGDALTWWEQANDTYATGNEPVIGSVLAFEPTTAMPLGHVAVVAAVLDDRQILLNHANWSGPGVIDRHALAVDVSEEGDWSSVRVWYDPIETLGARHNPTSGFIYASDAGTAAGVDLVGLDSMPVADKS